MSNPNVSPETNHETGGNETVLDIYFAEVAKGPEHCMQRALHVWSTLIPRDRLELQKATLAIAGDDIKLGGAYARSVLLLEDVNRQAAECIAVPYAPPESL